MSVHPRTNLVEYVRELIRKFPYFDKRRELCGKMISYMTKIMNKIPTSLRMEKLPRNLQVFLMMKRIPLYRIPGPTIYLQEHVPFQIVIHQAYSVDTLRQRLERGPIVYKSRVYYIVSNAGEARLFDKAESQYKGNHQLAPWGSGFLRDIDELKVKGLTNEDLLMMCEDKSNSSDSFQAETYQVYLIDKLRQRLESGPIVYESRVYYIVLNSGEARLFDKLEAQYRGNHQLAPWGDGFLRDIEELKSRGITNKDLLLMSGDIESNPGPAHVVRSVERSERASFAGLGEADYIVSGYSRYDVSSSALKELPDMVTLRKAGALRVYTSFHPEVIYSQETVITSGYRLTLVSVSEGCYRVQHRYSDRSQLEPPHVFFGKEKKDMGNFIRSSRIKEGRKAVDMGVETSPGTVQVYLDILYGELPRLIMVIDFELVVRYSGVRSLGTVESYPLSCGSLIYDSSIYSGDAYWDIDDRLRALGDREKLLIKQYGACEKEGVLRRRNLDLRDGEG